MFKNILKLKKYCITSVRKANMAEEVTVEVVQGKLRGKKCTTDKQKEYYSFQGVPFAKPPVGELRFKSPQPPETSEGTRDCTKGVNCAAQYDTATGTFQGDEDCLYLNVSTPKLPDQQAKLLPVMFFIHGGGFVFGSMAGHDGDFLVEKNVVYVATQYRLGIFGFLCLDIEEAQGNMGLKDQVQALKWVQQNIAKFGGDPNNVTIFGISAGGVSVEYLTISPMAKGLFHKAIAHSGSSLNAWANNRENDIVIKQFKNIVGKSSLENRELYKYLFELPAPELAKAGVSVMIKRPPECRGGIFFAFVPTVEKHFEGNEAFLTQSTFSLLKKGDFTKVPFISGVARREGLLMYMARELELKKVLEKQKFAEYLPFYLNDFQRADLEIPLKSAYLDNLRPDDEKDAPAVNLFTDIDFLAGVWIASGIISKHTAPTYFYEFSYDGAYNYLKAKLGFKFPGACHGDESGYILADSVVPKHGSPDDDLMRERMVLMWTNFAKYGNPTPDKTAALPINWEPNTGDNKKYLCIDKELTMHQNLEPARLKIYEELYEKYWERKN